MRVFKGLMLVLALALAARYFPVFYYSTMFNDMVKQEAQHPRPASQLRNALMQQAELNFLPVNPSDIQIRQDGVRLQVNVDYKVPVDLFVFKHVMTFHAA